MCLSLSRSRSWPVNVSVIVQVKVVTGECVCHCPGQGRDRWMCLSLSRLLVSTPCRPGHTDISRTASQPTSIYYCNPRSGTSCNHRTMYHVRTRSLQSNLLGAIPQGLSPLWIRTVYHIHCIKILYHTVRTQSGLSPYMGNSNFQPSTGN